MARSVIGVFADPAAASRAAANLRAAGFADAGIHVLTRDPANSQKMGADTLSAATGGMVGGTPEQRSDMLGLGMSDEEANYYAGRQASGSTLVAVDSPERGAEAHQILLASGAEDARRDRDAGETNVSPEPHFPTEEIAIMPRGDTPLSAPAGGFIMDTPPGDLVPNSHLSPRLNDETTPPTPDSYGMGTPSAGTNTLAPGVPELGTNSSNIAPDRSADAGLPQPDRARISESATPPAAPAAGDDRVMINGRPAPESDMRQTSDMGTGSRPVREPDLIEPTPRPQPVEHVPTDDQIIRQGQRARPATNGQDDSLIAGAGFPVGPATVPPAATGAPPAEAPRVFTAPAQAPQTPPGTVRPSSSNITAMPEGADAADVNEIDNDVYERDEQSLGRLARRVRQPGDAETPSARSDQQEGQRR